MYERPFGPRGAEDERDELWTDLSEVTDEEYDDETQEMPPLVPDLPLMEPDEE